MNKAIITFIILIGFVQMTFAQTQFTDSTQAYNYWAKRGVIEATYAYLQDYIITVGESNAKAEVVGKDKYFESFIQNINEKETLPSFNQISKLLKENSWSGSEKKLFNPLKKNFETKVPLNESFFRCTKPGSNDLVTVIPGRNNKNDNWNKKTTEIFLKYNESFSMLHKVERKTIESKPEPVTVVEKKSNTEQQPKVNNQRNPKQIQWKSILLYGSIFIIGILIGCFLILLITKSRIKLIINEEDGRKYDDYSHAANNSPYLFSYLRVVYFLHKQKDKYKKESESANQNNGNRVGELERKIAQLEKEKKELLDENIDLGRKLEQEPIHKNGEKSETKNPKTDSFISQTPAKKISKIYFSMPESDGSFQISNGEISNDGKKYFKIEFEESSNTGELFYLSGDRDQRAINRFESYLKPVCDIENITNSSTATKIELIHSGKVSRLNESWVIVPDNKIKIKLY